MSAFLLVSISVCALASDKEKPDELKGISSIAIVNFRSVAIESDVPRGGARCPVSGAIVRTCPMTVPDAEKILGDLVTRKVKPYQNIKWVTAEDTRPGLSESFVLWRTEALQKKGREFQSDAVLTGHVFCFRERVGYPLSVEKPASVAFGIYLVRTSDGAVLWKGIFDRTQQSLFENILQASAFFKGGGKWLTAEELAGLGIDEILKTFPAALPESASEPNPPRAE